MAKKKKAVKAPEGLQIKVNLSQDDKFGKKLIVKVALLQDGNVISEDMDFVKLPLK